MMKCLIVEDDLLLCETLRRFLAECGHDVTAASSVCRAMNCLRTRKFDLILLDYHLPDGTTVQVSDYAACSCPNTRIILLTGSVAFPNGEHSLFAPGVDWVLRKPVSLNDLGALVDYAAVDASRTSPVMGVAG